MKLLIQRVQSASVNVNEAECSKINAGLLIYLCLEVGDNNETLTRAIKKVSSLRILEDQNQKMNLNINQAQGDILVVSQFTLSWQGEKGNRPSFERSMPPKEAKEYYKSFCNQLAELIDGAVKEGVFGADMKVSSVNDGPVTFHLNF